MVIESSQTASIVVMGGLVQPFLVNVIGVFIEIIEISILDWGSVKLNCNFVHLKNVY